MFFGNFSIQQIYYSTFKYQNNYMTAPAEITRFWWEFFVRIRRVKNQKLESEKEELLSDLSAAIGETKVEKYNKYKWLDRVLANPAQISWFKLQREIPLIPVPVIIEAVKDFFDIEFSFKYSWKDKNDYKNSHWYRFQQAVKKLQEEAETILENNKFILFPNYSMIYFI